MPCIIDFNLDHLNIDPEPVFPGEHPIIDTANNAYAQYLTDPQIAPLYQFTYTPIRKISHALNTRTYWTFACLRDIGPEPYSGNNGHWVVLDTFTISTGKPTISWNTRLHPTGAQIIARTNRSKNFRLRPLPRLYTDVRAPFKSRYNNRRFAFHPLQNLDTPLLC